MNSGFFISSCKQNSILMVNSVKHLILHQTLSLLTQLIQFHNHFPQESCALTTFSSPSILFVQVSPQLSFFSFIKIFNSAALASLTFLLIHLFVLWLIILVILPNPPKSLVVSSSHFLQLASIWWPPFSGPALEQPHFGGRSSTWADEGQCKCMITTLEWIFCTALLSSYIPLNIDRYR